MKRLAAMFCLGLAWPTLFASGEEPKAQRHRVLVELFSSEN